MTLYSLGSAEEFVTLYARSPEDISPFILEFQLRCTDPRPAWPQWLANHDATLIRAVAHGPVDLCVGPVYVRAQGEPFWEPLRISDDFTLHMNYESAGTLSHFCAHRESRRIGPLYVLPRTFESPFSAIPSDIMDRLCLQDLQPFYERLERFHAVREMLTRPEGPWCTPEQIRKH